MEYSFDLRSIVVILHSLAAAAGVGAVIVTDYIFFKFLKDYRITQKEVEVMKGLSQAIWIALVGLVATGAYLVASHLTILSSPKFLLKMTVVAALIINGIVLNLFVTPRLRKIAFHESRVRATDVPDRVRKIATACGAISIFSWLTAFVLGSIKSIPFSLSIGVGSYFAILAIIAIGASLTKKKRD